MRGWDQRTNAHAIKVFLKRDKGISELVCGPATMSATRTPRRAGPILVDEGAGKKPRATDLVGRRAGAALADGLTMGIRTPFADLPRSGKLPDSGKTGQKGRGGVGCWHGGPSPAATRHAQCA